MKRIFLDTNVLLGSALARGENGIAASAILSACEYEEIEGCLSILSVANMAYILKKGSTIQKMKQILEEYTRYLTILPMDSEQLQHAYNVVAPDFEDVLQYECAKAGGCTTIVTSNTKHYKFCKDIDVVSTEQFANQFVENDDDVENK